MDTLAARVGLAIKQARIRNRLSQKALAEKVGYTSQGIWKIEAGKSDPSLSALEKIAEALGTNVEYLITGQQHPDMGRKLDDILSRLPSTDPADFVEEELEERDVVQMDW